MRWRQSYLKVPITPICLHGWHSRIPQILLLLGELGIFGSLAIAFILMIKMNFQQYTSYSE